MSDKVRLTDSQEARIVVGVIDGVIKEIVEVRGEVMAEIEKLRRAQAELHRRDYLDNIPDVRAVDGAALDLDAAVNRWQGIAQSALGNLSRITKEMQKYLKEGVLPQKKQ